MGAAALAPKVVEAKGRVKGDGDVVSSCLSPSSSLTTQDTKSPNHREFTTKLPFQVAIQLQPNQRIHLSIYPPPLIFNAAPHWRLLHYVAVMCMGLRWGQPKIVDAVISMAQMNSNWQ
jgi:hypothetical protein